jgi:hypothetical protein
VGLGQSAGVKLAADITGPISLEIDSSQTSCHRCGKEVVIPV